MDDPAGQPGQRIDRWLWYARFLKSRSLAATLVQSGRLRLSGQRISKASRLVRAGDILTFPLGPHIRVIKILHLGTRRGPAPEAALLYEDLDPPSPLPPKADRETAAESRPAGTGRPTKKEGRRTATLKSGR
ncbi:RNA-binding S4 domain protein [Parvibaculum lavamentivorans DS-1]|uniref:RNA-binding S4 domain protein n=1 Tax=Parvibaculum lavamentivorans (strain DS-1 / DSM 13023 / NCIMB 13966) TaxID=402881 RepID=A7HTT3_PARL1|nr:RNA-binding S4 domain-containing protein [Parvibaculum lavamentivorans]ABS63316.1 RNA-binding S4 domain protein [Parvibaculum lavamentivorans DS-1]